MAKIVFQDEEGQNLNWYKLVAVEGQTGVYALERVATITKQGTPYNKEVGDHFLQVEDGTPVQTLSCTKSGTVYALTGLTATAGAVSCIFKADAAFVAGNTVTINGTAYTLKTIDGTTLTAGAWAQGALVHGIVDMDNKVLYVAPSAPVGAIPATASCNKAWNWSGQPGQPSWLWGGNDASNMYVYNPNNFSVNLAANAHYSSHAVGSGGAALRNITMSTAGPSGGSDGDVWHQYS